MKTRIKFLFVVNPIAGGNDKNELVLATQNFAEKSNIELIVFETTGKQDEENIAQICKEHKPKRILVAGGDGTIKTVAEAVKEFDVIIGIIPAGSANGLAVDLNFPEEQEEIIKIAFENDFIELDLICLNNKIGLHLSDIGLNAELIKNYENGAIRGKIGYALQAFQTLTDVELPFHVKVAANGKNFEAQTKMVVIANSQKYGTGVVINPDGKMNDGKFEIIIIKNLTLGVFGKIISGNMPLDTGDVEIISTSNAKITTDIPTHFQIDGEYYGEIQTLDVSVLPIKLKVAIPNP